MKTQSTKMLTSWLLLLPVTLAHTWVEEISLIAPNGTFTGTPGYSRGYMSRMQTGFEDDMVYLLPPDGRANELLPTDTICKDTQTIGNQTAGFPSLIASPGDVISLRYQENGHVTLPNNQIGKPANRGTVFIYGTTQPSNEDKILDIHKVWNAAGTGGDGRGVLLATRNFDDGQCYQVNGGNISVARQAEFAAIKTTAPLMGVNLWCQSDVQLPSNVTADTYSLYWVWDWPTAANVTGSGEPNGKIEIYTTCMDIKMQAAPSSSEKAPSAESFVANQTIDFAAVPEQLANAFQVTEGTSTANPTATGSFSSATAPAITQSTTLAAQSTASSAAISQSTTVAAQSSASSAGATITVTVTEKATGFVTVTMQASAMATSYTTQYTTVTTDTVTTSEAATPPVATSSASLIVTPFLPTTTRTGAATSTPGSNSTTPAHKMLRSRVRHRLH